jgi:hypothetical protein
LEGVNKNDLNYYYALSILQGQFKEHRLENYGLVLFWKNSSTTSLENNTRKQFLSAMRDLNSTDQLIDFQTLINVERQRICQAKLARPNREKDLQFFAASVSLTKLLQTESIYQKHNNLSTVATNEIYLAIMNIKDPVLRIIACSIILDLENPSIFDEKQRDQLRWEMTFLLYSTLPNLPLLTSTLLFFKCHRLRQVFPVSFTYMANIMGRKLNEISLCSQRQDHEAVYIALRQLNNSHLLPYLLKFAKRSENLSDLLHFNSTVFYRFFNCTTAFDTSNNVLLSSMYLAELAFDAQILKIYINDGHLNEVLPMQELKQLRNRVSMNGNIMTFEVAMWITNYLQILNKEELQQIKKDVSRYVRIEKKSLSLIKNWLSYQKDENLKFFAHYATLQLIIHDSISVNLTDILSEIFYMDNKLYLTSMVNYLLTTCENLSIVELVLITLNQDAEYSMDISFSINRKPMLDLILKLEFERITSKTFSRSFLFMINDWPQDLQAHLKKYIHDFIQSDIQDAIKEKYLAIIIEWLILGPTRNIEKNYLLNELYNYVFEFLHNKQFPLVQKIILKSLNRIFTGSDERKKCIFTRDNTITHLEYVINPLAACSQDVLTTCLLAYGNCIAMLKDLQIDRNISDDTQKVLMNYFRSSSSEIISIRAAFCLIFIQNSIITPYTIMAWFGNQLNLTYKKEYKILLQQQLYSIEGFTEQIISCIQKHSVELLVTFVNEVYDYLRDRADIIFDCYSPSNYIIIAVEFIKENSDAFRDVVQKSSFGEEMFRKELYQYYMYYTSKQIYNTALIKLYIVFGVITVDLVDMLALLKDGWQYYDIWKYLENIKQVSDRDVIDKLFELLNTDARNTELTHFSDVLQLLVQLARFNVISLSEVHQQFSLVIGKTSSKYDDRKWCNVQKVCSTFLNLSCIKAEGASSIQTNIVTEMDIYKDFDKDIQDSDNGSTMFLNRHYFFNTLQSVTSRALQVEVF